MTALEDCHLCTINNEENSVNNAFSHANLCLWPKVCRFWKGMVMNMTSLLVAKQYIKNFISKYEVYLKPLLKLVLALASLMMINGKVGYMHKIDNTSIVLIVALMCSFMPMNFIILLQQHLSSCIFMLYPWNAPSLHLCCFW